MDPRPGSRRHTSGRLHYTDRGLQAGRRSGDSYEDLQRAPDSGVQEGSSTKSEGGKPPPPQDASAGRSGAGGQQEPGREAGDLARRGQRSRRSQRQGWGRAALESSEQLGWPPPPPPPSCPSPPREPDFTPPPARARRNSHFAAAAPAPTTAAASVTSRRRAAGRARRSAPGVGEPRCGKRWGSRLPHPSALVPTPATASRRHSRPAAPPISLPYSDLGRVRTRPQRSPALTRARAHTPPRYTPAFQRAAAQPPRQTQCKLPDPRNAKAARPGSVWLCPRGRRRLFFPEFPFLRLRSGPPR